MSIIKYAKEDNLEGVRREIENGVDVNIQNDIGDTALILVCYNCCGKNPSEYVCYIDIIKLLLNNGADVNLNNNNGETALGIVNYSYYNNGKDEIIKILNNKIKEEREEREENKYAKRELLFIYINKYIIKDLTNVILSYYQSPLRGSKNQI